MGDSGDEYGDGTSNSVSVFIGLGPAASKITNEALLKRLEEVAPVAGLRIRGRCAFADVPNVEAANRLVAELDGKYIGDARLAVQLSRGKDKEKPRGSHSSGGRNGSSNPVALFIGLGPAGGSISDKELRNKLEEVCPVIDFRRRGQCAFIDVRDMSHAQRLIQELNNHYMGDCRLSIQHSRENKSGRGSMRSEKRGRAGDSRDRRRRRRSHTRSRSRSGSRDRGRDRRRRRSSGSSGNSSYRRSSDASDESRGHRRRDNRRRARSRSYSSSSRSSSGRRNRRRE
ncbi:hypothetical protein ERJ75_000753900 [Trypanosoma vivax]|uniref:Putative splicing factor TSR1 n=1 Tax=Trypanosoma vivax (strain Y486) TaxID=1055687 RepID=G0U031_TRYVY|nr:putative splicing factor TSR1 [Trypanosoma vivax]KAH8614043.1 hypothetical protein ERJ75_000753900 [Trypanosoma vivax]CCC49428.1 putative splicing factor TSR1 [Trypanosoma vivax Y486]